VSSAVTKPYVNLMDDFRCKYDYTAADAVVFTFLCLRLSYTKIPQTLLLASSTGGRPVNVHRKSLGLQTVHRGAIGCTVICSAPYLPFLSLPHLKSRGAQTIQRSAVGQRPLIYVNNCGCRVSLSLMSDTWPWKAFGDRDMARPVAVADSDSNQLSLPPSGTCHASTHCVSNCASISPTNPA
jgi:hypothetical protein